MVKETLRTVGIWLAALLLAMLLGFLVAATNVGADGPVIWKAFCPRWHDIVFVPEKGGGTNVVCIRQAEEVTR